MCYTSCVDTVDYFGAPANALYYGGTRMPLHAFGGKMTSVPSYEQVIETYDIDILRAPGDLQLTTDGDIAVHDGDLKLGNDQYNAMFRLVQAWRFNSPTLEGLFNLVVSSEAARNRFCEEQEEILARLFATNWSHHSLKQYHASNDEIGGNEIGEAACAGAIFVILNNLLSRFQNDLHVGGDRWSRGGPLINGLSLGTLVSAAANNFRHYDEWRRSSPPSRQQQASMDVILKVLGIECRAIRENVCPKILKVVGNGNYEKFGNTFFEFAKRIVS
jgi:hypothetical protein